jgi:hypothetical protein
MVEAVTVAVAVAVALNIGSSQFEEHILIGAICIGRCAA